MIEDISITGTIFHMLLYVFVASIFMDLMVHYTKPINTRYINYNNKKYSLTVKKNKDTLQKKQIKDIKHKSKQILVMSNKENKTEEPIEKPIKTNFINTRKSRRLQNLEPEYEGTI